jgi:spore coat protein H
MVHLLAALAGAGCATSFGGASPKKAPEPAAANTKYTPKPLRELPWPGPQPAPPACKDSGLSFGPLELHREGAIELALSSPLQPVGVVERVSVSVLNDAGARDQSFSGTLHFSLPDSVEVVSSAAVVAGASELALRFHAAGSFRIAAVLDGDPRAGSADVIAYAPQLPIWELQVADSDLARLVDNPLSDEQVDAVLAIDGVEHATKLRLHGGSSRKFPKNSFRFDLADAMSDTWGGHLILRAEYNDKTLLRNWLALALLRSGTWLATPRAQLVHFRINQRYYGVMSNVERIDATFLKQNGLNPNASLYESDPPDELTVPGGNLTPLSNPDDYRQVYPQHRGTLDYTDLTTLIEKTLLLPDAKFDQEIEHEVVSDDYLVYLAMLAALQDHDQIRKNFYLYRDAQAKSESGWRVIAWDLDLTLGHLWTEENETLDETIFSHEDIYFGERLAARGGFYNALTDRILKRPVYRARFHELLDHIVDTSFTHEFVEPLVSNIVCRATPDLIADSNKRATNDEYLSRIDELYQFIAERADYIRQH